MPCCPFYYQVSVHNRGDAYSILESDAKDRCRYGFCRQNYSLLQQRKLVSDAEGCCSDGRSRRAILHRHDDYAAAISKSGLEIKNRCTKEGVNGKNPASIRKSGPEIKNRCTQVAVNREILALIRKFGPEIKNRCTQVAVNRENLASIPKFGPEIKNRCTKEGVNEEKLASILKSGHEIKNQCTQQATFSTRSLDESLWR